MKELERTIQETWKGFYKVTPGYIMHESEIDCCNEIAQAIKSYIIEIVGEEKEEGMNPNVPRKYAIRQFDKAVGHNNLRTTILKRLEGEL